VELEVIRGIVAKNSPSLCYGIGQLLFIAQAPTTYFVRTDHVKMAQSQRRSNSLVDVFVQVQPNE
jgi:hypothetical protein